MKGLVMRDAGPRHCPTVRGMRLNATRKLAAACLALACLAVACLAPPPIAVETAAALETEGLQHLELSVEDALEIGAVDVVAMPATTDPQSIQVGIRCGMEDMCGQDPCLCGAVDAWGACACNGFEELRPQYSVSAPYGDLHALNLFGTSYLVSFGFGGHSEDMELAASLPHYATTFGHVAVQVRSFGAIDVLKLICALAIAVAVLAALFGLAYGLVTLVSRLVLAIASAVTRRKAKPGRGEGGR